MKFKELKTKTQAELLKDLVELRTQAHDLGVKMRLNQVKNTQQLKFVKKDIARIMTFLHQVTSNK